MSNASNTREPAKGQVKSLSGLKPFLQPYWGRVALAGFFLVMAAVTTLVFPAALKNLIDSGLVSADKGQQVMAVRQHFGALFAVAVALGLFSACRYYVVTWLGERVTADIRNAVYAHVLRQSPEFFETTQTGEVLSRLNADTTLVQTVVGSSLSMGLRNAVMGIGALVMLVWHNPMMMVQVLGLLILIVAPIMWFGRRVRKLSRASQDRLADSSAIAAEVLNAITTVQSHTAEGRESARFDKSTNDTFATAVRRSKMRAALVAFIIIATSAALLWGLYQGTQSVMAGRMSAGELGQTVVYVIILASAFAVLGEVYGDLLRAAGATERLMELLAAQSPVQEVAQPTALPSPAQAGAAQRGSELRFEHVQFHYPSRPQQAALKDFDLAVRPGETMALVGASGAGKTTVFQLILRHYDPQSGQVVLNGTPIAQARLNDLREQIAVVPQEPVIFSTSALENIRYGRPNASDDEVKAAARAAYAHDFIEQLPEGYHTYLGERGVRLSGGQRQRIAIARAMLKDAPLLLLDEATSALDAESERMVQAALDAAMESDHGQRTTLVIAHRLATVQKATRIVVMEQGRIIEQGTHAELVAAGGAYARLAKLQFTH